MNIKEFRSIFINILSKTEDCLATILTVIPMMGGTAVYATKSTAEDIMFAAVYETIFKKKSSVMIPDALQPLEAELAKLILTEHRIYTLDHSNLISEVFADAFHAGVDTFKTQPSETFKKFLRAKAEAILTLQIDFVLEGGNACSDCIHWDNWGTSPVNSVMEYYDDFEQLVVPVTNLIPDSEKWTASEWLDWDFVSDEMSKQYDYNYADDPIEFDVLLKTWIKARSGCIDCLRNNLVDNIEIKLDHMTYPIARALWPTHTLMHIQNALNYTRSELSKFFKEEDALRAIRDTAIHKLLMEIMHSTDHALKKAVFDDEMGASEV